MSNLAKTKERKFVSGMNRRYKLIFSNPVNKMKKDDWVLVNPKFTLNFPANLLEESQISGNLAGITSQKTQLKVLSIIDDVQEEINQIKKDKDNIGYDTDYPTNRTVVQEEIIDATGGAQVSGKQLNGAQTQSLIAIMAQFSSGSLTEGQAVNLVSTAIGISKEEAKSILNGEL